MIFARQHTLKKNFDKIRLSNCTIYIRRDFHNPALEQALAMGGKALTAKYKATPMRASKFARVFKFAVELSGRPRRLFYKEYLYRSIWDFVKHIFRPGRAKRAYQAGLMLQQNGFDVPEVIALGERRNGFFCTKSFLLTREVENAQQIYRCIPESRGNLTKKALRDKRELIRAFGRTVGRMHAAGIFHGDLRLGNVLARQVENTWQFFFLDNERTKKFHRLPARLRLKNLVQTNMHTTGFATNADRLRFFKAYLAKNKMLKNNWKIWSTRVSSRTALRL